MSKNREPAKLTIHASSSNSTVLALAKVGNGSRRTTAKSSSKLQIRSCGRGLLHQMGRSKSTSEYYATNDPEVLLTKHNRQIRSPKRIDYRQCETIRLFFFQRILQDFWHSCEIFISKHPQSNGVVERANGLIFLGIKKCLFDQNKGKWFDELPKVIWSHNTTVSRLTGFTPFRLLLGTEAMTQGEIKNERMRVLEGKEIQEVDQKVEKNMIELTILKAAENIEKYQKETKTRKDRKVVRKDIKTGDLVL
jgi:hypothetical protein